MSNSKWYTESADNSYKKSGDEHILVELEGGNICVARIRTNIIIINGHFSFDMPPVLYWSRIEKREDPS